MAVAMATTMTVATATATTIPMTADCAHNTPGSKARSAPEELAALANPQMSELTCTQLLSAHHTLNSETTPSSQ